jgi:AhpD family alkylhydroperoxidase
MNNDYQQLTQRLSASINTLRKDKSGVMRGFSSMASAAMADGVLDRKTKELIALAIGIAGHCKGCIGFHTQSLVKLGATRAEIEDALGVAIYMGGGPSLMYAAEALQAFDEFDSTQ